jgi:hypothetical protein
VVGAPEPPPPEPPQDTNVKRIQLVKKNLAKKLLLFITGTTGEGIIVKMVTSISRME